jgi:hypothetical protein
MEAAATAVDVDCPLVASTPVPEVTDSTVMVVEL